MSQSFSALAEPPSPLAEAASPISLDTRALRNALGRFATGVAVVTTIDSDGRPVGLTINSFASVSLEPPLVLWSLAMTSQYLEAFRRASHHCINILTADQLDISNRFATWPVDRFAGLAWHAGCGGAPRIEGCGAHFEVANQTQYEGGDHLIFIGRVEDFAAAASDPAPLLFYSGRYRHLTKE